MNVGSVGAIGAPATIGIAAPTGAPPGLADGGDFSAMLYDLAQSTKASLVNAESASMAALQGKADTRSVVEAVMRAEQSLQTGLAVRDKLVAAFQEITRMSI